MSIKVNRKQGIDPTMMDPEKLITQGNYEFKCGNADRALGFIDHGLAAIFDLDPLLFWSPSGGKLSVKDVSIDFVQDYPSTQLKD